ncbi:MAG: glutamate racemase [Treponema sp.]|nr:glutamate racemase [Treponema sp.]
MDTDFIFLDSGIGGIPYLQYMQKIVPEKKCKYFADEKNFPYGTKTAEQILEFSKKFVEQVLSLYKPKVIVLACNTMTVTVLEKMRELYPEVAFVGTVPAIKLAAKSSKSKKIGLLATEMTVKHDYIKKLVQDYASDCEVVYRADTKLVDFVEKNVQCDFRNGELLSVKWKVSEQEKIEAITDVIDFFKKNNVDTIILGCTHFVHLVDEFEKVAGDKIQIVDSRDGVAKQALRLSK